jgi:CubicO group peptidase (beta-lactamase class C family)
MKRRRALGLALLLAPFLASGKNPGPDAEIDRIAKELMRTGHMPGMALCVIQHGRVLASRTYGLADLENGVPVSRDSEFSIASTTKQLTAAAILQLAERGSLSLDDDISRFVKEFPHRDRGVTIRRLLNHTAGVRNLQDLGERYWNQSAASATPAELIELFKNEPLDFEPGTAYHYSNSGYILLGAAIESITGETYGDYVRHHLLDPLDLKHMTLPESLTILGHRVHPYWYNGTGFVNARYYDGSQGYAMGGIYSSAEDLARWTVALHHGLVLGPFFYQLMITPETLLDGEPLSYGYGMEVGSIANQRHVYSHAGGGVGFISQALYVPEDDLAIAALSNSNFGGGSVEVADQVMRKILHIPGPADLALPAGAADRYAGRYCMDGQVVDVVSTDGHLLLRDGGGGEGRRLRYQGDGVFAQDGRLARLHFREEGGRIRGFVLARYGSALATATREN